MTLVLGMDQGGTKTDIVIADETGSILAYENDPLSFAYRTLQ